MEDKEEEENANGRLKRLRNSCLYVSYMLGHLFLGVTRLVFFPVSKHFLSVLSSVTAYRSISLLHPQNLRVKIIFFSKIWSAYLLFIVVSGQIWDLQPIAMSNPSSPFSPVHTYKRNIGARIWDFWAGTLVGKSCVGIFRTLERISSMEKKRIVNARDEFWNPLRFKRFLPPNQFLARNRIFLYL